MNIFNATCISRIAFRTPLHSYLYYLNKQYFPARMSGSFFLLFIATYQVKNTDLLYTKVYQEMPESAPDFAFPF